MRCAICSRCHVIDLGSIAIGCILMDSCQRGDVLTMTDITRRDFLKLLTATAAALALPIAIVGETLHLDVEVNEDKLKEAMTITLGNGHAAVTLDQATMWQAVSATDQRGRVWTTPDGKAWSCGADSFTLEG